ncbi:MAG: hypothetical protein GXY09_12175 [Bacteroidales bacterium]|nr:hypothetical protein [Bacteroidales bacterium]
MKKSRLLDLYRFFYKKKPMMLVLYGWIFALACTSIVISISLLLDTEWGYQPQIEDKIYDWFVVVMAGPFIGVLLSPYLPLKVAGWFKRRPNFLIILFAALIFGGMHYKSLLMVVTAFLYGLCWALFCLILIRRRKHPLFHVWLMYALHNAALLGIATMWPE